MFRIFKYFFVFILVGHNGLSFSQNEAKRWYFGNYCALDFNTNPPTNLANGAMATPEGCSSIADASGNLLFYTNGVKVWNKSHTLMANGTGLLGDPSSSQSALIIRQPGSSTIYFIFTTDGGPNGLRFSTVDISLAAGMGSVTAKNLLVYAPSTTHLCGITHCNGTDIWLVSHDMYSDVFRANLVTPTGVSTTSVLSAVGPTLNAGNSTGCMKISPNGKKLGAALYGSFGLFDFNTATGVISNFLELPVNELTYGCEFSPDGTKFYGSLSGLEITNNRLIQWDLCSGSDQAIIASANFLPATHVGQLQLAPDGKIYMARAYMTIVKMSPESSALLRYGESIIAVIHNPNANIASVNFNDMSQPVGPSASVFGLPNFVCGFYKTPVAQFTYSVNPAISCFNATFTAPPLINATCSATSYTATGVKWFFDDPASAATNTSAALNPQHIYTNIGTFKVRMALLNACGGTIDTLRQTVIIGGALANNASTFTICSGQSTTLVAATTASNYSWSTGASSSSIVVTPSINSTYSLSYTDAFGCARVSVQTITVESYPVITVSGKGPICEGAVSTQTVKGALMCLWSTGSTNSAISVTPAATTDYTVTGYTFPGCGTSTVITVIVKPSPLLTITGTTTMCTGDTATLFANGISGNYVWDSGTTGQTRTLVATQDQSLFSVRALYSNGCARFKSFRIYIRLSPSVSIDGSSTVCIGSSITLTANGAITYSWNNGSNAKNLVLVPTGNAIYTVIGTDTNNCARTATIGILTKPSSISSASVSGNIVICEGESSQLSAAGGNRYVWQPASDLIGQGNNQVIVTPSITTVYSVTVSFNGDCGITKTVIVSLKPKPKFSAGNDTIFNLNEPMFINATGDGTISWIGGEGIACPDCPRTEIFPVMKTCYVAQSIGNNGCVATDEVCVDLGSEYAIYIPNAFTPNNDGLNDTFSVKGFGISNIRLTVFDRWGEKLFTSDDEKQGWDGSYQGNQCHTGVYNWVLEFISSNKLKQQKTGRVTLLR